MNNIMHLIKRCGFMNTWSLLFFIMIWGCVWGQSSSQLQRERQKLLREIKENNEFLEKVRNDRNNLTLTLRLLERQINQRKKLIDNIQASISVLKQDISVIEKNVAQLQNEIDTLKRRLGDVLNFYYLYGKDDIFLSFIFSADNLWQSIHRYIYIKDIVGEILKYKSYLEDNTMQLQNKQKNLMNRQMEYELLLSQLVKEKENLSREYQEKEKVLDELKNKEKSIIAMIREKEKKLQALQKKIEEAIRAEELKKKTLLLTPEVKQLNDDFEKNFGNLPWPLKKGIVTERFGVNYHPVFKNVQTYNQGINIESEVGAKVFPVFSGYVSAIVVMPGGGKAVLVRHGSYTTVYYPLEELFVKENDKVSPDKPLGILMNDPLRNTPELHFEIWKGKEPQDPLLWLYRGSAFVLQD